MTAAVVDSLISEAEQVANEAEKLLAEFSDPNDVLCEKLAYLAEHEDLLHLSEFRRTVTEFDPLMFALIYLPHIFIDESAGLLDLTLSEFHVDLCEHAVRWALCDADKAHPDRDAYIAPRGCGKSTWFFLILPLWAAAHGHYKFIAAFGVSGERAQEHLMSFKAELEGNEQLRSDYPKLCTPAKRMNGVAAADRSSMYKAQNGFIFTAKGILSSSLGLKVGKYRPELIILDDIEPGEESYNASDRERTLVAVRDSIIQLNAFARLILVGTVTMPGSLVHDVVRAVKEPQREQSWVHKLKMRPHYYPALITDITTGLRRSIWPEKWSVQWLLDLDEVSFFKSYQNDPMSYDGGYWSTKDITHWSIDPDTGEPVNFGITHEILSIDPAVTDKKKSDYTGVAVIGWNHFAKKSIVRDCWQIKVSPGQEMNAFAERVIAQYPAIGLILVESNQGGQVWVDVFRGLGVRVRVKSNSENKSVRAMRLLKYYQQRRVVHEKRLSDLETQMIGFPKLPHDDMVDAVGNGVDHFITNGATRIRKARLTSRSYV